MKTFRSVTIFLLSLALVRTGSLSGIAQQPQPSLAELHDKVEGGIAAAQNLLGLAYAAGSRVPKDEVEAAKWFRKAADQTPSHLVPAPRLQLMTMNSVSTGRTRTPSNAST